MCRWAVRIFAVLYALALFVLIVGTYGLFGQERDPLSAVYLIPLGFPWIHILDDFGPWVLAAMPLVNLGLLAALCAWTARRSKYSARS